MVVGGFGRRCVPPSREQRESAIEPQSLSQGDNSLTIQRLEGLCSEIVITKRRSELVLIAAIVAERVRHDDLRVSVDRGLCIVAPRERFSVRHPHKRPPILVDPSRISRLRPVWRKLPSLRGKSPRVRGFADFCQRFFGETPSQKDPRYWSHINQGSQTRKRLHRPPPPPRNRSSMLRSANPPPGGTPSISLIPPR